MKIRGDFIGVNLSTGEQTREIVGDGECIQETVGTIPSQQQKGETMPKHKNFKELQAKMSSERQRKNALWAAGWKARYDSQPLEHDSEKWRDGWAEADQAILGELASKNKLETLAEGFAETMPKGEGRLTTHRDALVTEILRVNKFKSHYVIANTPGWEVFVGMAQQALQEKIAAALQSVPSSPPLAPNKPGSGVLSPETIEKAVEIADKFFAGAGAPSDAGQPERERFLAVHEITCELESLAEGKGYPCPELHVSRPLGKALVAYTEKIQRDASNAALEKLRERIQSEVLTLFAPAPRPAEKG